MANPPMATIERLRVDAVQLAHGFRQIAFRRFHHQVEVVIHQAVGMQEETKPGDHARQHSQKVLPVLVIEKDVLLDITTGGNVIQRPREFDAKWSSHR